MMDIHGIPVDYRLRPLIKKLPSSSSVKRRQSNSFSEHVNLLQRFGKEVCMASDAETNFASFLAGPSTEGGVTVALLQPRKDEDDDRPFDEVTEDCATLRLLQEFSDVCGTSFSELNVFDAYAFVKESLSPTKDSHSESLKLFNDVIVAKAPDVVLSCWRKPWQKTISTPCEQHPVECRGIGRSFESQQIEYAHGLTIKRVNAFNPSFAINHHPD